MPSLAAICSFMVCGPVVTYVATSFKQRKPKVSSSSELYDIRSFDGEEGMKVEVLLGLESQRGLYGSKSIIRSDSEYSLGLNIHDHYVFDEVMTFGLCNAGHYVIGAVKAAAYISVIAAAYGMHRSLEARHLTHYKLR
jgi:hypothetical protein